jgi:hypothetical protein
MQERKKYYKVGTRILTAVTPFDNSTGRLSITLRAIHLVVWWFCVGVIRC